MLLIRELVASAQEIKILLLCRFLRLASYPSPAEPRTYPRVAVSRTPSGIDADAEATLFFLYCNGDVGQLTALAADCSPAPE